ncbi:MAG: hypothetical protein KGS00_03605 [Alphaproteobacteria bacterium]|nr:hypothetical protein [Alphaproteobacteria bacterium]
MGFLGRCLDQAKAILLFGGVAFLLSIAGLICLAAAAVTLLDLWLPLPASLALTAVACLSIAAIVLWVGLNPPRAAPAEAEPEADMEAVLSSLTEVPVEIARKIITERPIAALVVFSGVGALIARRPALAVRIAERLISRFT